MVRIYYAGQRVDLEKAVKAEVRQIQVTDGRLVSPAVACYDSANKIIAQFRLEQIVGYSVDSE